MNYTTWSGLFEPNFRTLRIILSINAIDLIKFDHKHKLVLGFALMSQGFSLFHAELFPRYYSWWHSTPLPCLWWSKWRSTFSCTLFWSAFWIWGRYSSKSKGTGKSGLETQSTPTSTKCPRNFLYPFSSQIDLNFSSKRETGIESSFLTWLQSQDLICKTRLISSHRWVKKLYVENI